MPAKIDATKLRLYSVTRRTNSGSGQASSAAASRCNSADAQKFSRGVSTTGTSLTSTGAACRTTSKDSYSREGSKASALTRRSMSSEDARRLAKERMSRPPDIAPVRGGNINIENVTPEYVQEFWTRKKMESDEFRRRRQQLAEGQAKAALAVPQGGLAAAEKAPAHSRQPLRVSRPVAAKGAPLKAVVPPSGQQVAGGKPSRSVSPPQRTTSPKNNSTTVVRPRSASGSGATAGGKVPPHGTAAVGQASPTLKKRAGGPPSPSPVSLPVARRLLVGTALSRAAAASPQDGSPPGRPVGGISVRPSTRPSSAAPVHSKKLVGSTANGASPKSGGITAAPPRSILSSKHSAAAKAAPPPGTLPKRVHIDPATIDTASAGNAPASADAEAST